MYYSFTTLTKLQYNNSKFKKLLINLSMAIKFIDNNDQLKALEKIFFVKLIKKTARLTNFVFGI